MLAFFAHLGGMGSAGSLGVHEFTEFSDARVYPQRRFRTFEGLSAGEWRTIFVDVEDALGEGIITDTVVKAAHGRQDLDVPVVAFFFIERQIVTDFEKNSVNFIFGLEGLFEEPGINIFEDGVDCKGKGLATEMERGRADSWSWVAGGGTSGTFGGGSWGAGCIAAFVGIWLCDTGGRPW
jgi:hypothetical protein